jgi:flagellar protein FlaG
MAIQQLSSAMAAAPPSPAVVAPRPAPAREPPTEADSPPVRQQQPAAEQVRQALQEVERAVQPVARNLQFSIDKDTGKTIVKVVDAETQEVIRQIPGEEILAIAKAIDRMQGLLLKQRA